MIYRDNNLLALAQGEPCLLRATRHCLGSEGSTTVSAHSNELRHGKARSIKAEDVYSVWACYPCHTWLDQGSGGFETKTQAWERAHLEQIEKWREIADNPLLKPWKIEAAKKALEYLESKNG